MGIFSRIRSAFQYERASKFYNAGRYEEALRTLDRIDSTSEMMAKIVLFRANIKYRMKEFNEAERLYRSFREIEYSSIGSEADRVYLRNYSEFHGNNALRRLGRNVENNVGLAELLSSSRRASYLTRSEFVPPNES